MPSGLEEMASQLSTQGKSADPRRNLVTGAGLPGFRQGVHACKCVY